MITAVRSDLPTGTVTFLFTDVEGSTKLLRELGAEAYADALAEHRRIVREACAAEHGVEVDTQGDAFFFAFASAPGAVTAAQSMTDALADGQIHLRIGLHTGTPLVTDEGYVGDDVHFAARVGASAHGGQVVLSQSTRALMEGLSFTDLGEHRLKDIETAVPIYQLGEESFPPLKTISNTNLPRPASSFIGRERELSDVLATFERGTRLLTLTGPGGSGKTRLAVEAAATLVPSYKAGVFWVGLASLREPSLVTETIAQTLGARDGLAEHIADREMLLLLDNLEQVIEAAPHLSALVAACPNLALLVTSRELLRVQGEAEYSVPPLESSEAVTLFCQRSGLEPSDDISELCARLDDLPLAVELAAARTKALTPTQILDRLSDRLDLLQGGRDADARQQTLRATIEWSYALLSEEEQRLFRALSVFRGGCTLDAAEEVCGIDLDTLQSLVEKSLLRFTRERYWMLETIREYTREQLDDSGGTADYALRHARWYLARLEANYPDRLGAGQPEILAWYDNEEDNLRAMLDRLSDAAPIEAARAAYMLHFFWRSRGAAVEEHERLRALLVRDDLPHQSRAALLVRLSDVDMHVGRVDTSEVAAREALALAEPGTEPHYIALVELAFYSMHRGDTAEAVRLGRQAAEEAETLDDVSRIQAMGSLADILAGVQRFDEARALNERCVQEARRTGLLALETLGLAELGRLNLVAHEYGSARAAYAAVLTRLRSSDTRYYELESLKGFGLASLGLGQRVEARAAFSEMLELALAATSSHSSYLADALSCIALAAEPDAAVHAARLRGAVARLNSDTGVIMNAYDDAGAELDVHFERQLVAVLGEETWEREKAAGSRMTLDEAIEVALSLIDSAKTPGEQAPSR
jgi:predicted ATPase/class 3 adenylate cyclase